MKKVFTSLFLLSACTWADIVIEQKIESSLWKGCVIMKFKGDQARVDMSGGPGGNVTVLMNVASGEVITFMHEQKLAMKVNASAKKQAEVADVDSSKPKKPKSTGQNEKVGEWVADVFEGEFGGSAAKFWVVKEFPNYNVIQEQVAKLSSATGSASFNPSKFDFGGMLVKSEVNTPDGKVTTTLVRAKEEAVNAEDFKAPSGYREMIVPACQ